MRDRKRFQNHPTRLGSRFEFVEQARLADPRLSHRCHDLPVPRLGLLGRVPERLHLALAPDELGQSTPHGALQSRAQRAESGDLTNLDQLAQTLYPCRPARLELEVTLHEFARLLADCDGPSRRYRLHPRSEV